jgi:lupus La protein
MSNLKVETSEPDPAATSLPNDETVNKDGGDPSVPTDKEAVMAAVESKDTNGTTEVEEASTIEKNEATADVEEEKSDDKTEDNGAPQKKKQRTYDDGVLKTSGKVKENARNSKYDPSVLPTTDDPGKIRAQVCSNMTLLPTRVTDVTSKG